MEQTESALAECARERSSRAQMKTHFIAAFGRAFERPLESGFSRESDGRAIEHDEKRFQFGKASKFGVEGRA